MAHGAVRFLLRVLEAVLLVALLGSAFLSWRLSHGPIALNAVAPYVASLLSDLNPSLQFRIERADFRWQGFKGSPEITARDVRVLDAAGGVVAALPTMLVRLESSALLKGQIAPKHISLSNPIIRFVHRPDGTFGLGIETASGPSLVPSGQAPSGVETSGNAVAITLLNALSGKSDGGLAYLETLSIDHTTLVLVDETSAQRWLVPDATLDFTRDRSAMLVQATLPVIEDGKSWQLTAKGTIPAGSRLLTLDIDVDGLRPARLAALAPQLAPLAMVDLRLSGIVSTSLALTDQGARISSVKFDVEGQAGQLRLPAPVAKDYPIRAASLRGTAGDALDEIKIDHFRMEIGGKAGANPVLSMTADAKQLNSAPDIQIEAALNELSIQGLKDYWPETVKPNTREWIVKNLTDGGLTGTKFRMKLAGTAMADLAPADMLLTSSIHDMTVAYMAQMPKVRGTSGEMALTLNALKIDVRDGHVPDDFSGKGLRIPNGTLLMKGLGSGTELADFDLHIVGDFGDAMRLIDNEPLQYSSKMGVDAAKATGTADVELSIDFPLVSDLELSQVRIGVKANTENVGLADVAFGLPLTDGAMTLALDDTGMDVAGSAKLGGIPTKIDWRENFSGGEFRSRYILDPVVANEQRPLVRLTTMPFVPPYLDGDVPAHVVYTIFRDQTRHMEADVDLTEPAMALPELGWKKAAGVPARGKVTAKFTGDRLEEVPSFAVTSGDDLSVEGSVVFGEDGSMTGLSIKPSTAGETKISLEVKRNGEGYDIVADGSAFNATDFLKEMNRDDRQTAEEKAAGPLPMTVRASFYRMWLAKDDDFRNTTLTYERTRAGVQAIDFKGSVNGTVPVSLVLSSTNGARKFKGESSDGGAVVRALGLFKDIVGGHLEITGEVAPDGTTKGVASIANFQVVEAPVLARLLSVAALTGILDELRGSGISFSTLRMPFSYANSQLTVEDGEMFGSALGLTAKGTYGFKDSAMDMEGTIIPAYAINSAFNKIPLIGDLITGGDKGSGIFAATYTYKGPIATAQPSVNPLAALAPGFLRRVFDIFRSNPQPRTATGKSATPPDASPAK